MSAKRFVVTFLCCCALVLGCSKLEAQQLRVSNIYLFNPWLMNPASVGSYTLNNLNMSHQQRKVGITGWRSFSEYLNFSSQPIGKSQRFGWGVNVQSDYDWTEFRLGINGMVSAALIKTDRQRLSVGIMAGLINWGSNYKNVRVYDRSDELLYERGNFADIDAGLGGEYRFHTKKIRFDLNGYAMQLPGNVISKTLQGLTLYPHLFIAGGLLFSPVHNIFIGPRFYYKDIIDPSLTIGGARTDVGLRIDFDRQKMWYAASLRPAKEAGLLNVAFGLRIKETDTVGDPTRYGYFVNLNGGFSFPMASSAPFGPTAEIGLSLAMGRNNRKAFRLDTVRVSPGPFWKDEGNLNDHMVATLKPNGPQGLRGITRVRQNGVEIVYTFDDNSYQYVGNTPQKGLDTLFSELGPEWIGMDGILENIVSHVIAEGLSPDTNGVVNPEVLEPLKDLVSMELSTALIVDELEANEDAKGMLYEGEMGTNNRFKDSLLIKVVYNEKDTIIGIGRDQMVSNLQLAALKLHAMRKKLEYELVNKYGEDWAILWEGEEPDVNEDAAKKIVYLKTPRITPNNPNQPAYQVSSVKLRFTRGNVAAVSSNIKPNRRSGRRRRPSAGTRIRDRVY